MMWKKALTSIALSATLFAGPAFAAGTNTVTQTGASFPVFTGYSDVQPGSYGYNAIMALTSLGVLNGMNGTQFDPNAPLTRAQMAKFITMTTGFGQESVQTIGAPIPGPLYENGQLIFTDVTGSDWFWPYVSIAQSDGYVNGVGNHLFDPNGLVTENQAITMTTRLVVAGIDTYGPPGTVYNPYPSGYLYYAGKVGLLAGLPTPKPGVPITRAQAAVLVWNALQAQTWDCANLNASTFNTYCSVYTGNGSGVNLAVDFGGAKIEQGTFQSPFINSAGRPMIPFSLEARGPINISPLLTVSGGSQIDTGIPVWALVGNNGRKLLAVWEGGTNPND